MIMYLGPWQNLLVPESWTIVRCWLPPTTGNSGIDIVWYFLDFVEYVRPKGKWYFWWLRVIFLKICNFLPLAHLYITVTVGWLCFVSIFKLDGPHESIVTGMSPSSVPSGKNSSIFSKVHVAGVLPFSSFTLLMLKGGSRFLFCKDSWFWDSSFAILFPRFCW